MLNDVNRRDRDFLRAVRRETARSLASGVELTTREAVGRALTSPAPSFYLTTEYAWRVLRGQGEPRRLRRSSREAMWEALRERYREALGRHPGEDPYAVLDRLLREEQAPGFFISEARALSLYFKLLTTNRNGNQSELRHDNGRNDGRRRAPRTRRSREGRGEGTADARPATRAAQHSADGLRRALPAPGRRGGKLRYGR